jgi:hypothetical protein
VLAVVTTMREALLTTVMGAVLLGHVVAGDDGVHPM